MYITLVSYTLQLHIYLSERHFILKDNTPPHSLLCTDLRMLVLLCY